MLNISISALGTSFIRNYNYHVINKSKYKIKMLRMNYLWEFLG